MQSNLQWLYENTPRGRIVRNNGTVKDTGLVVICGSEHVAPNKNQNGAYRYVRFSTAFSAACQPVVATAVVCNWAKKWHCVVTGPNGTNYPNSSGFDLRVKIQTNNPKTEYIRDDIYIHWIAMGFRDVTVNEF